MEQDGQGVPDAVEAKIKDELWFTESSSDPPKVIRNSLIMAWCDGLPAFRLVSRRPPNALPNRSPNDVSIIALMFIIAVIVNVRQGWRSNIVFLLADHIGGTLQIFLLRYLQSKY